LIADKMAGSDVPLAETRGRISTTDQPRLIGYHVVVGGRAVVLLTPPDIAFVGN
jgi:hypothetical protein